MGVSRWDNTMDEESTSTTLIILSAWKKIIIFFNKNLKSVKKIKNIWIELIYKKYLYTYTDEPKTL